VVSDFIVNGRSAAVNKPKGDGFMIAGAIMYGLSNGLEEFLVRDRPLYEVVGQLGFWGVLINGAQAAGLESHDWIHTATWSGKASRLLLLRRTAHCLQNIGYLVGTSTGSSRDYDSSRSRLQRCHAVSNAAPGEVV
jgi:hypothetical protein